MIRNVAKELLPGLQEMNTVVIISMIYVMDTEKCTGLTEQSTRGSGKKASSQEKENFFTMAS